VNQHHTSSILESVTSQAKLAKQASRAWGLLSSEQKNEALAAIAEQLKHDTDLILSSNAEDVRAAEKENHSPSYLDRLRLNHERINALVNSIYDLIELPDPIGEVTAAWDRPNGLHIEQVRVPLGVIGMIYEARPNVTVDAAVIALKTGNAIVLRGSRSARRSNESLVNSMRTALQSRSLPHEAIQLLSMDDREAVDCMCTLNGFIDCIIPRGGAELIQRVVKSSTVPVLETGVGNCHIFVEKSAAYDMAESIVINAKTSRPAVCNAAETLLLHKDWPKQYSSALLQKLAEAGVELRACQQTIAAHEQLSGILLPASPEDWDTEYLDLTMAVCTVDGLDEALSHISEHGTGHSEAIITTDEACAKRFLASVDAATVYHNASTRFTDGGEFGFGAEIGISTQKMHARGPMGLTAITSTKYKIYGAGQIR